MPPEPMEIKMAGSLVLWLFLPHRCLGDCAAAACSFQRTVFWMEWNSRQSLASGWPGRGRQGYSSLDVLEGTTSEAETNSSKIV